LKLEMASATVVQSCNGMLVREVTVDRNAMLQYKLTQIVRYADDKCLMGRMKDAMK
jgi:hypothetical protein